MMDEQVFYLHIIFRGYGRTQPLPLEIIAVFLVNVQWALHSFMFTSRPWSHNISAKLTDQTAKHSLHTAYGSLQKAGRKSV